jgi:hypothetical protein
MTVPIKVKTDSVPGVIACVKPEVFISLGLFLGTVLSRIPFRSRILYHWDSVNFAYAMREFSVAKEQPHPPGYIVYVWLCRVMDLLFHDAQVTMVWISIAASALAIVALFCLGKAMWNRRVGLIAALFLASSPLFWFYGEIALPHTVDTFLVILSVWWLYEVMRGNDGYLLPGAVALGIAGGVRQQTLVFLAPLGLFAVRRIGWRRLLGAALLGAIVCLAWFIPLMYLSGGFTSYMRVMGAFTRRFQSTTSVFLGGGWWGVQRNVRKLGMYTLYGWGLALVPAVIWGIVWLWQRRRSQQWEKAIFLLLWIAPSLIFYTIIHMGQQGLIFVFLPALLLVSAKGLEELLGKGPMSRWLAPATATAVLIHAGIFYLTPEYPLGPGTQRLLTHATLVNSDHYYEDRFTAIRHNFASENTTILATHWHHVEYYLPEYVMLPFDVIGKWEKGEGNPKGNPQGEAIVTLAELGLQPDAKGQIAIVIFDSELAPFNESPELAQTLVLEHGSSLEYLVMVKNQTLHYGSHSLGVVETR